MNNNRYLGVVNGPIISYIIESNHKEKDENFVFDERVLDFGVNIFLERRKVILRIIQPYKICFQKIFFDSHFWISF